jgi:hypothetical protein
MYTWRRGLTVQKYTYTLIHRPLLLFSLAVLSFHEQILMENAVNSLALTFLTPKSGRNPSNSRRNQLTTEQNSTIKDGSYLLQSQRV